MDLKYNCEHSCYLSLKYMKQNSVLISLYLDIYILTGMNSKSNTGMGTLCICIITCYILFLIICSHSWEFICKSESSVNGQFIADSGQFSATVNNITLKQLNRNSMTWNISGVWYIFYFIILTEPDFRQL